MREDSALTRMRSGVVARVAVDIGWANKRTAEQTERTRPEATTAFLRPREMQKASFGIFSSQGGLLTKQLQFSIRVREGCLQITSTLNGFASARWLHAIQRRYYLILMKALSPRSAACRLPLLLTAMAPSVVCVWSTPGGSLRSPPAPGGSATMAPDSPPSTMGLVSKFHCS
jgi:hypothetical protein